MISFHRSILTTIGNTPLVELTHLSPPNCRILAKIECVNPGASKKDRVAKQIIEDATADGSLKPGQTVVELTSGNTGTGLAIVCRQTGHPFVAVMSKGNSMERVRMISAFGGEVVLVDQAPGSPPGVVGGDDLKLVELATRRIVAEQNAFRADQFVRPANFRAHYLHTGPEILEQSPYPIDVFADFVGTGGSFAGVAAALKAKNPATQCYVVEPATAAVLAGKPITDARHRIQGGGYSMPDLKLINRRHIDGCVQVHDGEAIDFARRLASEEGIFAGFSSGANLAAVTRLLQAKGSGVGVFLVCDSGLKYMSNGLFT
jgi:cysteine synthase A